MSPFVSCFQIGMFFKMSYLEVCIIIAFFLWQNHILLYGHACHILFVTYGYLECFDFLAVVNSAAMNILMQICVSAHVFVCFLMSTQGCPVI